MTPLNISSPGADITRHDRTSNENASGATEARKPNHCPATIAFKNELLNQIRRTKVESVDADADLDDFVDSLVLTAETAANDLMQEDDTEALVPQQEPPGVTAMRYLLLTDDDLSKLPPIQWRIKDLVPVQGIAVVFGPSGSGKSALALDIMQSLAMGREWFGRRVKQCSVTYVVLEGKAGLAGRVKAYRIYHGSTSPNIVYLAQPFGLLKTDDINDLVLAIKAAGTGDVVVIDTLSRATPGLDENSSKDMGNTIAAATLLQELLGGLVLLVHHSGKEAAKGMRGHSSLHAAVDCAIEVKRIGDQREWIVAKSKDGADGASHSFTLEVVSLGKDSDGDEETSCVVVPNQSTQAVAKKKPSLASNQTIAHKALEELLRDAVDSGNEGAPTGVPGVLFDEALAIVATMMPGVAKHQKQRAKEAIGSLVTKGYLAEKEGWLTHNQSP
jgi:putative DNA primase/helicase